MDEPKRYYSPEDVAMLLGLHVRTVRRYIRDGRLNAARIGKQYRISRADLDALMGSEPRQEPLPRQRRVLVSTIVDVDAISREEADRVTTAVTGAAHSSPGDSIRRSAECIYYEERASLRIAVNGDADFTTSLLGLVEAVLEDDSRD